MGKGKFMKPDKRNGKGKKKQKAQDGSVFLAATRKPEPRKKSKNTAGS